MNHKQAIKQLEALIENPEKGLSEDVFLFVSRLTPLINVDLLIKDEKMRTLLTWRKDAHFGEGWHVPGGIIRYRESIAHRIIAVAETELGAEVQFDPTPLKITEFIDYTRLNRAHGISLLFACTLLSPPRPKMEYRRGRPLSGQWRWWSSCPPNILRVHKIYHEYI